MSHHLDSPLARQDSRLDITDLFVFPGDGGTAFIMDSNTSAAGEQGRPGFHPEARYEFKIHLDGSPTEDLTYRVSFGEMDGNGRQTFSLHSLTGSDAQDDAAVGTLVAEGRTDGDAVDGPGLRIWAGKAADPFYIDLTRLATITTAIRDGKKIDLGGWSPAKAKNSFAGMTVQSIVLEVSDQHPQLRDGRRIGVWITTKLATDAGGWRQINREGHAMVWPVFRPDDTDYASDTNRGHPADDVASDGEHLAQLVAAAVMANGTASEPMGYGKSVAASLLPDVLPYVIGSPAIYGFAERNGRALEDNAPEVIFSLAMNAAIESGLTAGAAKQARNGKFPYIVPAAFE